LFQIILSLLQIVRTFLLLIKSQVKIKALLINIFYKKEMNKTTPHWFSQYKTAWLVLAFGIFFSSRVNAQATTYNSGSSTYSVPVGATILVVETWGGGGGGGTVTGAAASRGSGGGGGGYSRKVIVVTQSSYNYNVGGGGAAGTAGADSWVSTSASISNAITLAKGGGGGVINGAGGAGGSASFGIGDVVFSGGSGGTTASNSARSGQGGSSAGTLANGVDGLLANAAVTAPTGGGNGANGGGTTAAGVAGVAGGAPGGGGSGAFKGTTNSTTQAGGAGGAGKIVITAYNYSPWGSGSRDLFPPYAQGRRTVLFSHTNALYDQGMPYMNRGIHKVYAVAGEKIYIGSSTQGSISIAAVNSDNKAPGSGVVSGGGAIRVYKPSTLPNANRDNFDYWSGSSTTIGKIANRSEELLGPKIETFKTTGYTPYAVPVTETGVYEIEFLAPAAGNTTQAGGTTPSSSLLASGSDGATVSWTQPTGAAITSVLAWDITVADPTTGTIKPDRAYINVFNGGHQFDFTNGGFFGKFYVLTKDGFPYVVENNGMNGGFFTFFVNNRGFTSTANGGGERSLKSQNASVGLNVRNPNQADDALNTTHKMFYGQPSSDLPENAAYNNSTTFC
jgi:hypothetical protein